eukprot:1911835-Rhodomonas_salina.1
MLPEEPLAALLLDGAEIGRDDLGADGGAAVVDVRLHLEEPRRGVEHCLAPLLPRLVHARRRRSLRVLHAFRRQHRVHRPCFRALRHRAHALSRTFHLARSTRPSDRRGSPKSSECPRPHHHI